MALGPGLLPLALEKPNTGTHSIVIIPSAPSASESTSALASAPSAPPVPPLPGASTDGDGGWPGPAQHKDLGLEQDGVAAVEQGDMLKE